MSLVPKNRFRRILAYLACLLPGGLLVVSATAADDLAAEIYMADVHESAWVFKGGSAFCELSHEIPQFGQARFQRLAGKELSFRLDSYQPVPERIEGVLREVSPPWNRDEADKLEQLIVVEPGLQPVKLDRRPAGWLLSALAKGQIGSFDMLDWNDSRKQRKIRLSPVNFQQPYREFKQCLRELGTRHSTGFAGFTESGAGTGTGTETETVTGEEGLRALTVHFALDVYKLDGEAKAILRRLAETIKADPSITAVRIAGHADDQGTDPYNLRLSSRRAKRVYDYLVRQGVARKLLSQRHYGESQPKLPGRTEKARAANRRAEIELIR